jgi:hypothetical protein
MKTQRTLERVFKVIEDQNRKQYKRFYQSGPQSVPEKKPFKEALKKRQEVNDITKEVMVLAR